MCILTALIMLRNTNLDQRVVLHSVSKVESILVGRDLKYQV